MDIQEQIGYALRPYQVEAISKVTEQWDSGNLDTLCCIGTGGGKTNVGLELIDEALADGPYARALFVVPTIELVGQAKARVEENYPHIVPVGVIQDRRNECNRRFTVATIQSLMSGSRLDTLLSNGAITHLVVDEAHRAAAPSYKRLIQELRAANPHLRHVGLTATPERGDGVSLGEIYQSIAVNIPIRQLVRECYAKRPRWYAIQTGLSIAGVGTAQNKSGEKDYNPTQLASIYDTQVGYRTIVKGYLDYASGRQTIAFTASVRGAEELARAFIKAGIPAAYISGSMNTQDRDTVIAAFENGKHRVLTNCQVLTEGWDCPQVSCVLMCRPTRSNSVYLQKMGRGLRPMDGHLAGTGEDCVIIDFLPKEYRDLVTAADVLMPSLPQDLTHDFKTVGVGEVASEFVLDGSSFETPDGKPLEIWAHEKDYLDLSPYRWSKHEGWQMLNIGVDDDYCYHALLITPWERGKDYELLSVTSGRGVPPTVKRLATGSFGGLMACSERYVEKVGVEPIMNRVQPWFYKKADVADYSILSRLGYTGSGYLTNQEAMYMTTWMFVKGVLRASLPNAMNIELSSGSFALVDAHNFLWVHFLPVQSGKGRYGRKLHWGIRGNRKSIQLRVEVGGSLRNYDLVRIIMKAERRTVIIHSDGNSLNCCQYNLAYENINVLQRQGMQTRSQSGYQHVSYIETYKKKPYGCFVQNGTQRFRSYHDTPEEAARTADIVTINFLGLGANLNFPLEDYVCRWPRQE